jgi:hypothetical protein
VRPGKPTMKARIVGLAAGLAIAFGVNVPAQAQFMTNYPVIIVPPPPAQNLVIPRSMQKQAPPKPLPASPAPNAPPQVQCHFQGQTRVCE